MGKKTEKKAVIKAYETACENIVKELRREWDISERDGYWIGDEIGGLYDHESGFTITVGDMVYCIEHDISRLTYMDYLDYNVRCLEYNLKTMNLKSYIMGAPRVSDKAFDNLDKLKKDLNNAIKEELTKQKG